MHKRLCIVQNMLLEKLNSEMYDESPPQSPSNLNLSFSSETSSSSEFIILKKERLDSIDELDISSIVKAEVVKIEDLQID